jgi:DNA-directed RNA polymerase
MIEPMGEPWGARVGAKIGASGYPEGTETLGVAALVAALRSAGEASPSLSTLSEEQRQAASDALHDKHTALRRLRDQLKTIRSPVIALTKAIDSKRKESQWKLLVRQLEWENMATEDAVKKYKEMSLDVSERTEGSMLPASRKIISSFYEPLVEAMKEEIGKVRAGVFGIDRRATGTYLQLVRPEHLAVLTLHTTMSLLLRGDRMHGNEDTSLPEAGRVRVIKLVLALGEMIEAQCSVVVRGMAQLSPCLDLASTPASVVHEHVRRGAKEH